jgi:hypothetical protein
MHPSLRTPTATLLVTVIAAAALLLGGCAGDDLALPAAGNRDAFVYVRPGGSAAATGAIDDPLPSLRLAVNLAATAGYGGVRVAAGEYAGDFNIIGGVDIVGGCDPQTWLPETGRRSVMRLAEGAVAARDIELSTTVSGLEIIGDDRPPALLNSAALHVEGGSANLVFRDCVFRGGNGTSAQIAADDGAAGAAGPAAAPGQDADCVGGVPAAGGRSDNGVSRGGDGGGLGFPGFSGSSSCYPDDILGACPAGGAGGGDGQPGGDGQDGPDGRPGANGAASDLLGLFVDGGFRVYVSAAGEMGRAGAAGSGGGGGGGDADPEGPGGGGGGSGGEGGRGGFGGGGGLPGGHSIGVVCHNSEARFVGCVFTAANGGDGSNGGDGAPGGDGSPGEAGGDGCAGLSGAGGRGGHGGRGGGGGGGAGGNAGWSIGLLAAGERRPALDDACTFSPAQPGAAGAGGQHGDGVSQAPDGMAGQAVAVHFLDGATAR